MDEGDWGDSPALSEAEDAGAAGAAPAAGAAAPAELEFRLDSRIEARVVRVTLQEVRCEILRVDECPLKLSCTGTVRLPDIMAQGIDRFDPLDCFVPGDVIRARLVATGLSKTYLMTTAPEDCGVLQARSACCRADMEPVASSLMRCPSCHTLEYRKTARRSVP